ncbi:MAG TPA: hypothetical protein VMS78_04075 [Rhizomicrobium sp.]|nr:hypothetical protein [Rhizomicrobium sp.]
MAGKPTKEEIETWATPKEVLDAVSKHMGSPSSARQTILERLRHGIIAAYATHAGAQRGPHSETLKRAPIPVVKELWGVLANNPYNDRDDVWRSGDFKHTATPSRLNEAPNTVIYFGVRFHPDWRKELLPKETTTPTADLPPETKGPTVSQAALKAWFEAYQIAFPDSADTEATAVTSAQGCFPGKSVSREAIRRLRGEKKRGRKTQSAK